MNNKYDVIIIGGGPAGSSSSIYLRKSGLEVAIFEKEQFPRPHVGESLVPFCYDLFQELDILETLQKTAVRKPGVQFTNNNGTMSTTYNFGNILQGPNKLSFHVLREKFDNQLLNKAKEIGVHVFEKHKVIKVDFPLDGGPIVNYLVDGIEKSISCRFIIDASGQDTFLSSRLQTKKKHKDLLRTAFLRHWICDTSKKPFNSGVLQIVYLDQHKKGWLAIQPVDVNRVSVGLIISNEYLKEAKKKYDYNANWKEVFYRDEVFSSPMAKDLLEKSTYKNNLLVVGDYSYQIDNKFGDNFALIGDSAGFLDPIFATGVYLAINTAKLVSLGISTYLTTSKAEGKRAIDNAYKQYEGALTLLEKFIYNYYDPSFINLAEISEYLEENDEEYNQHLIAFSMLHFLMGGDFFNEYDKYIKYLDFLKDPKQLARYFHMVIRPPSNTKLQEYSLEEIFPMLKENYEN